MHSSQLVAVQMHIIYDHNILNNEITADYGSNLRRFHCTRKQNFRKLTFLFIKVKTYLSVSCTTGQSASHDSHLSPVNNRSLQIPFNKKEKKIKLQSIDLLNH